MQCKETTTFCKILIQTVTDMFIVKPTIPFKYFFQFQTSGGSEGGGGGTPVKILSIGIFASQISCTDSSLGIGCKYTAKVI